MAITVAARALAKKLLKNKKLKNKCITFPI